MRDENYYKSWGEIALGMLGGLVTLVVWGIVGSIGLVAYGAAAYYTWLALDPSLSPGFAAFVAIFAPIVAVTALGSLLGLFFRFRS